ncbi:MAG: hypothetical protein HDT02_04785 [Bacteroidales bacterium]|nr:hypothetical protein [Bacteroidales bacterium]
MTIYDKETMIKTPSFEILYEEKRGGESISSEHVKSRRFRSSIFEVPDEFYISDLLDSYRSFKNNQYIIREIGRKPLKPESDIDFESDTDRYSTPKESIRKEGEEFAERHISEYLRLLDFGSDEILEQWFHALYEENRPGSLALLGRVQKELLCRADRDPRPVVKLLNLLRTFDYEEIADYGILIVTSAMALEGDEVKSAVISIFDHWATQEVYNLMTKLTRPESFLVRLQYDAVLKSLEQKYVLSEEN